MKRPVGEWLFCQDEFGDAAAEMEYYRDLLIPYGGRYSATMKVADERDETTLLGLTSRIQTGPFNDQQRDYINRIGGHLRQAIAMYRSYRSLQSDAAVGNTLIVRIPKPIFVIRPDRTVVTKNEAATALLEEVDSPFRLSEGRLEIIQPHLVQPFESAIQLLKNGDVGGPDQFISLGTELRKKWLAVGVAFFSHTPVHKALAHMNNLLVTVYPRAVSRTVEPSILQAALSLTRAEAKLAALIFAGDTVRDAAANMGVAETTAKTHLMSVFNKTGVAKQSELVRLIASLISS
jgi:DNA-binding CsgD family transcriptional regulator